MTKELYDWIVIASTLSPLAPLTLLLIDWKGQPQQNRILAISIFISLAFDVIAWTMKNYYHRPNGLAINLYFIVAFPAIMWFYYETLIKKSLKNITRIFSLVFFVSATWLGFTVGLRVQNHELFMLSSILISITSLLFIRDLNIMNPSDFLKNQFHLTNIILNTSLALYYFATMIMFAISDYVFANASVEGSRLFWALHNALNIGKHVGIAVAFYLSTKPIGANRLI